VQHEVRSVPLQRLRLCEVDTAVTRATVPLVELWSRAEFYKTTGCVTRWGFVTDPHAVRPRGGSTSGYSLAIPAMRRDSHDHPLVGFRSPSGYCPLVPPNVSRRRHLSWGLCPYSAYRWEESTLLPPAVSRSADYGPSSGFEPSRRFTPPPTSPRLSTQQHSWGSPYRVFPSRTGPRARRSQITLVALFPRPALSPPRKERTGGAKTACLGAFRLHLLVAFRALLRSRVRTVREHD